MSTASPRLEVTSIGWRSLFTCSIRARRFFRALLAAIAIGISSFCCAEDRTTVFPGQGWGQRKFLKRVLTASGYSRILATLYDEAPDYRSDRSESPEGRGIAYGRSRAFWNALPESVRAELSHEATLTVSSIEDYPAFIRDAVTSSVVEDAELIGFWWPGTRPADSGPRGSRVAPATIYRKIRRFRARFGSHPDEHRFEWIKLDLKRAWTTSSRTSCAPLAPGPSLRDPMRSPGPASAQ